MEIKNLELNSTDISEGVAKILKVASAKGFKVYELDEQKIAIGSIILAFKTGVYCDIMMQKAGEGLNQLRNFIRGYKDEDVIKSNDFVKTKSTEELIAENIEWGSYLYPNETRLKVMETFLNRNDIIYSVKTVYHNYIIHIDNYTFDVFTQKLQLRNQNIEIGIENSCKFLSTPPARRPPLSFAQGWMNCDCFNDN